MSNYIKIENKVFEVFMNRFRNLHIFNIENIRNKELFDNEIGLNARDLIYLLFDIEKEFKVQIPEEEIAQGNFDSIDHITNIVFKQINENSNEFFTEK
jgi:peptide maturation system acyl carrier-related protein